MESKIISGKMSPRIFKETTLQIKYSKESFKNKQTTKKTLSRLSSLGKTFTESTQQGMASKKSFILKTPTLKIRSEKSMHGNGSHKVHLVQEKLAKNSKRMERTISDEEASKSSLRKNPAIEADISQQKSSRKDKSDDTILKEVSISSKDSMQLRLKLNKSKNKSRSKNKSLDKLKSPASLLMSRTSEYSINSRTRENQLKIICSGSPASLTSSRSKTSTNPGSITSLHNKWKSAKSLDQVSNISMNDQLIAIRKSKKTMSKSKNSLEQQQNFLERCLQDSTESLNAFENQEEDIVKEVEDEQTKRFTFLEAIMDLPDINDLSETMSEDLIPFKEEDIDKPQQSYVAAIYNAASVGSDTRDVTSEVLDTEGFEYDTFIRRNSSDTESSIITLASLIESEDDSDDILEQKYAKPLEVTILDITNSMKALKPRSSDLLIQEIEDEIEVPVVHEVVVDICHQFLNHIINDTVAYSEDYNNKLRRLLDKHKLMTKLSSLIGNYREEKYTNTRLEKLVSDYLLRKQRFSSLSHRKERDSFYETRLTDALQELDRNLIAKKEIIEKRQTKTTILREQVEEARIHSEQRLYDFETLVKKTLCNRDGNDHLKQTVHYLLKQMERFRNEMYEIRFTLCVAQHQFADMESQSLKMEDLGNGLNINEYLSTQAETETLASKIAEKNGDLKRLGEKGKLKHNKIMKEINELKSSGWLAHYPALKHDYDKTQNCVKKKKESIEKLREELDRLEHRLKQIEKSRAC
ncbi:uncharacterized protein LOC6641608 isoform X2 [Drosophila willistoni]|uniref:uncharacterized protein LOC6641608 isoform X2 n=1 Tax=Drosophila willistoni TaxID=7260 RepID=UPI001F075AF0|nr:uncharacterized protein LOC6641608 isoform X2 [Drosophila willistoni]